MKNIEKIAAEILKEAFGDPSTVRGIKILWNQYSENVKQFSKKLQDLIRRNRLSLSVDKSWILKALKRITGEDWVISRSDFVVASKK